MAEFRISRHNCACRNLWYSMNLNHYRTLKQLRQMDFNAKLWQQQQFSHAFQNGINVWIHWTFNEKTNDHSIYCLKEFFIKDASFCFYFFSGCKFTNDIAMRNFVCTLFRLFTWFSLNRHILNLILSVIFVCTFYFSSQLVARINCTTCSLNISVAHCICNVAAVV